MTDAVADAIRELAAAIDRQTQYLRERDVRQREDWRDARAEDRQLADQRREQDYERQVRLRADERVAGLAETMAIIASRRAEK